MKCVWEKWLAMLMVGMMVGPTLALAGAEKTQDGRSGNNGPDMSTGFFFEDFNYTDLNSLKISGWVPSGLSTVTTGTSVIIDNDGNAGTHLQWTAWPLNVYNYSIEFRWKWTGRSFGSTGITVSDGNLSEAWGFYTNGQLGYYEFGDDGSGTSFGTYSPQINIWRPMKVSKINNSFFLYMDGTLLRTINSTNDHANRSMVLLDFNAGYLSTIEIDWVRVIWEVKGQGFERHLSLQSDRSVYIPGDSVFLNATINELQWTWEQKASGATGRYVHSAVWDTQNNQMLIYGGNDVPGTRKDLWAYSPSSNIWVQKADAPITRYEHSAVWDSQNNQMLIFSGAGPGSTNDLWAYYPSNNTWVQKANGPSQRWMHSAVWDDQNNQMIIFGGYNNSVFKNDTWAYIPSTNSWVQKANGPAPRYEHSAVWDSESNQMLLYGGTDNPTPGTSTMNDTWAYNPSTDKWTKKADCPITRVGNSVVWDPQDNRMLIFGGGGTGTAGSQKNDMWAYIPSKDKWVQKDYGPTARDWTKAVWDPQNKQMIIFGGYLGGTSPQPSDFPNDTWVYHSSQSVIDGNYEWSNLTAMPTTRISHAATALNGTIYVMGGEYPQYNFQTTNEGFDTRTNTWTTMMPMPTSRIEHTTAVVNNSIYVISGRNSPSGGGGSAADKNEMYIPSTNTWVSKAPMPTIRWGVSSAVIGDTIYVIGGYTGTGPGDTNIVEAYNTTLNSWTTKAPLPIALVVFV